MAFKVFNHYDGTNKDKATLRPNGSIYLRNTLLARLDTNADYVTLLFDAQTNKLGIKFTIKGARKITKEKSGVSINIVPLLRYYGLDQYIHKHLLKVTIQKNMFVIDLSVLKAGKS